MDPRPFTVHIPDDVLADLRDRLTRVRWPDQVPGAGWQFGTDPTYLRELIDYWRNGFDWRAQEAKLNSFCHFTVPIGGVDLHFIHQPGIGPSPLLLLVSHGWPGSVWEFRKIIPLLTPSRWSRPRCPATASPSRPTSRA